MSERFDPYQAWLGVPRSAKPSYYQLLGLPNFESEPPVIAEAADQAIAKVAAHRNGPEREAAERVLGKLKTAKEVLLSSEKRAAYDQQLRAHLGAPTPPPPPGAPVSAVDSPTTMLPPGALPPLSPGGYMPSAPSGYDPQGYAAGPGYPGGAQAYPPTSPYGQPPYGAAPGAGAMSPGFPPQAPGYPAAGYAPQAPGYGPQAPGGYAQQSPGGYPAAPGMPPQAAGFPPQPGYAPQQAYSPAGDPFGGGSSAAAAPGAFVPFAGLSQALSGSPSGASPASAPFGGPPGTSAMAPPMSGPPMTAPAMGPTPGMPGPAPARSADPGFAPRQSTPAIRRGTQRRQQNSTIMVALGVMGGAVALLVIAMIAANRNDDQQQARNNDPPIVVPPPSTPATPTTQPGLGISYLTPEPARVDPSFSQGGTTPGGSNSGSMPSGGGPTPETTTAMNNSPSPENIIGKLIPDGYKPSPATPTPTGMMPEAMPSATPSATATAAAPGATPSGTAVPKPGPAPKPTPISIAGTPTGAPAMEASIPADAARARTVQTMTKSVKASLKARDYAKAEEVALQSLVLADAPDVVAMTFEQHRAIELVRALWNGTRDGIKSLKPDEEIVFNGKAAKVVRHDETTLVVSQDNKEIPLQIAKLVPGLAVQMAERALPADDAATKLAAGVFLSVDAVGDKERGRALIDEAGAAGAEVETLIAWLDMPE